MEDGGNQEGVNTKTLPVMETPNADNHNSYSAPKDAGFCVNMIELPPLTNGGS
ncbi:hypothetical protein [Victivallis sp. Marseille-Q1083]|uniref:hypothetical protein n=1 Tax=Victivallis sp. Marseille-Q1083 TaxID=2717288 RepID=UPI001C379B79|nr:hypothetical protein [Victivallis sp. Marseille-Q1083]